MPGMKPFVLTISNIHAEKLIIADLLTSDPYIKIKVHDELQQTPIQFKNLNPSWHEEYVFHLIDLHGVINFQMWDYDEGKENGDFMGDLEVAIKDIHSFDLQISFIRPLNNVKKGILHFSVLLQVFCAFLFSVYILFRKIITYLKYLKFLLLIML